MNDVKLIQESENKSEKKLTRAFIKGLSEILVLGKKPTGERFDNYLDALNHDTRFLQEDFMGSLITLIKKLPPEKKLQLKNELLSLEVHEGRLK